MNFNSLNAITFFISIRFPATEPSKLPMEPSKLSMESKDSLFPDAAVSKLVFDEIVRTGNMDITASMIRANLAATRAASHSISSRDLGQEVGGKAECEVGRPKVEQIAKSTSVAPQTSSPSVEWPAAGKQVHEQQRWSQSSSVSSNRHDGRLSSRQIDMLERGYKRPRGGQNATYYTNLHKLTQEWKLRQP